MTCCVAANDEFWKANGQREEDITQQEERHLRHTGETPS